MAQIKFRTSGGAWQAPKEIKTWDGSQWRRRSGYRWTGATWDPIITYRHDIITAGSTSYTLADVGSNGFVSHGSQSGYYSVSAQDDSGTGGWIYLRATTDIDVTAYGTLYVDFSVPYSSGSAAVGLKTGTMTSQWSASHSEGADVARKTVAIDIAALSGGYRFGVNVEAYDDSSTGLDIYNAWME